MWLQEDGSSLPAMLGARVGLVFNKAYVRDCVPVWGVSVHYKARKAVTAEDVFGPVSCELLFLSELAWGSMAVLDYS